MKNKVNYGRIPKQIVIGGHIIPIKPLVGEGETSYGNYSHLYRTISIRFSHPSQSAKEQVLLHLILRCIIQTYNMNITDDHLNVLGEVLYQVLKQNKIRF